MNCAPVVANDTYTFGLGASDLISLISRETGFPNGSMLTSVATYRYDRSFLANDSDPDGDALSSTSASTNFAGYFGQGAVPDGVTGIQGSISFTLASGTSGAATLQIIAGTRTVKLTALSDGEIVSDTLTVQVSDGRGGLAEESITINIVGR